jgi:hypothetical protein
MAVQVSFIPNGMFPKPFLPHSSLNSFDPGFIPLFSRPYLLKIPIGE